jgi:hypothetical protein
MMRGRGLWSLIFRSNGRNEERTQMMIPVSHRPFPRLLDAESEIFVQLLSDWFSLLFSCCERPLDSWLDV